MFCFSEHYAKLVRGRLWCKTRVWKSTELLRLSVLFFLTRLHIDCSEDSKKKCMSKHRKAILLLVIFNTSSEILESSFIGAMVPTVLSIIKFASYGKHVRLWCYYLILVSYTLPGVICFLN
jgi:hypothetical protein